MASSSCKRSPNEFCFICGEYIKWRSKKFSMLAYSTLCEAYGAYFHMTVEDQDKPWVPQYSCDYCKKILEAWYRGESRSMKFAVPRIWQEPSNHENDCYFCLVDPSKRRSGKNASAVLYPNLQSSSAPVPHSSIYPVPIPPHLLDSQQSKGTVDTTSSSQEAHGSDTSYIPSQKLNVNTPYFPNQSDINDLVRDLGLPKQKAEILISRLQQWNLLDSSVKVTDQRIRHEVYASYFTDEDNLCFCHDVPGLFAEIGIKFDAKEWRLFIDGSCKSLKAVLLHNGNDYPSLPLAHSTRLKENYESVKILLQKLKYYEHQWEVIGDFKVVTFFMGLQGGNTKYPCYLCLWDSRAYEAHYKTKEWPPRTEFTTGVNNVKWEPLVDTSKVLMPPLHIKLGLMKQFVNALDKESEAFQFLKDTFPSLSEAKVKAGVFVGPQIKKVILAKDFLELLKPNEKAAWRSFVEVVEGFLGNHRAENYEHLVKNLIKNYHKMGCRMSLKVHMLDAHLHNFKENMGAYSEEHGERFHQDIKDFECRYQRHCNANMMGDYIWCLIRESDVEHKRKSLKRSF